MKKNIQKKKNIKGKIKLSKLTIIILGVILLIAIIFYFLYGLRTALITSLGLIIIIGFARLLDATKKKNKQRKILKSSQCTKKEKRQLAKTSCLTLQLLFSMPTL